MHIETVSVTPILPPCREGMQHVWSHRKAVLDWYDTAVESLVEWYRSIRCNRSMGGIGSIPPPKIPTVNDPPGTEHGNSDIPGNDGNNCRDNLDEILFTKKKC
jgi:hypothetical protein